MMGLARHVTPEVRTRCVRIGITIPHGRRDDAAVRHVPERVECTVPLLPGDLGNSVVVPGPDPVVQMFGLGLGNDHPCVHVSGSGDAGRLLGMPSFYRHLFGMSSTSLQ
jgi:hypothetical protein